MTGFWLMVDVKSVRRKLLVNSRITTGRSLFDVKVVEIYI